MSLLLAERDVGQSFNIVPRYDSDQLTVFYNGPAVICLDELLYFYICKIQILFERHWISRHELFDATVRPRNRGSVAHVRIFRRASTAVEVKLSAFFFGSFYLIGVFFNGRKSALLIQTEMTRARKGRWSWHRENRHVRMVRLRCVRTCAHGKLSLKYFSDTKEIQKISLGFFYL